MMVLALDSETSGLPVRGMSLDDPQYPWMVQVGAVLFDETGQEHGVFGSRIRAKGRSVRTGAEAVHGISTREASRSGLNEIVALGVICGYAAEADYLTGFNVTFDQDVAEAALRRLGKEARMLVRPGLQIIDLIGPCAAVCQIPSEHESGSYRWPNLDKACEVILGEPRREGNHDALADAGRAKRLFLELRKRGLIEVAA